MSALLFLQIVFAVVVVVICVAADLMTISSTDTKEFHKVLCCDYKNSNIPCKNLTQQQCDKNDVEVKHVFLNNSIQFWCLSKSATGFMLFPCHNELKNQEENQLNLINLKIRQKCCLPGYIYSRNQTRCLKNLNPHQDQQKQPPVALITNELMCSKQQILVEYSDVSRQQLDFVYDGTLLFNNKRFSENEYCVEEIQEEEEEEEEEVLADSTQHFMLRICEHGTICSRIPCMRRCCGIGQRYGRINGTTQCMAAEMENNFESLASLKIKAMKEIPKTFGMINGQDCVKYRSTDDEVNIINTLNANLMLNGSQRRYNFNEYCVERIGNDTWVGEKLDVFLCFDKKTLRTDSLRFQLYPAGLLISCGFYAMTLVVYLTLPKLRNLPGKILICLVFNLLAAYLSIAIGQLKPAANDTICSISAFFIYFCLMGAFGWMNVLSFDIWRTFGSSRSRSGLKSAENKQLLIYSAYGWGLPVVLTSIMILMTELKIMNEKLRPQFGDGKCWFDYESSPLPSLIFFSGPIGLLFIMNFVLFSLTLRYCNEVKREINRMQSSNMDKPALRRRFFIDKARFAMNTKLFIVMGITWLLEIVSIIFYDHKKTMFWVISDSFNVLLGVFIFVIYVFKRRVWVLILDKFGYQTEDSRQNKAFFTHTMRSSVPITPLSRSTSVPVWQNVNN